MAVEGKLRTANGSVCVKYSTEPSVCARGEGVAVEPKRRRKAPAVVFQLSIDWNRAVGSGPAMIMQRNASSP